MPSKWNALPRFWAEIADYERQCVEPLSQTPVPATLYLGRTEPEFPCATRHWSAARASKEDGSAKTREVKLVTVWSAESHRDSLAGLPHPRA